MTRDSLVDERTRGRITSLAEPRYGFPANFRWGAATAAFQVEGASKQDERGESIWDRFASTPGNIRNSDSGQVACDHYHRYREDIALMQRMNIGSYRFSIAWPRIQPRGQGAPNKKGLDFYDRLVDSLLEVGIHPFPTLYHWDLPQALEDKGGWPNRETASRFAEYAEIVVRHLGDRITDWILFNEPWIFTFHGYLSGKHAPGLSDPNAFLRATHVVNLAQGQAFTAIKSQSNQYRVGTAFNMAPCVPATLEADDAIAAERAHGFVNLWFLEPALRQRYPDVFIDGVPFNKMGIRAGDFDIAKAPFDFIGLNVYSRFLISSRPSSNFLDGLPIEIQMGGDEGPKTDFGWEIWPEALYEIVMRITRDYARPTIEITENGCSYNDEVDSTGNVKDFGRIDFHEKYLFALRRAIQDGANVSGYHAWSLLDNFEWEAGYSQRFGLIHVNFANGKRTIKESGRWYSKVAAMNGLGRF